MTDESPEYFAHLAETPMTVTLPLKDWRVIIAQLWQGPFQIVAGVLQRMETQTNPQLEAAKAAASQAAQRGADSALPAAATASEPRPH